MDETSLQTIMLPRTCTRLLYTVHHSVRTHPSPDVPVTCDTSSSSTGTVDFTYVWCEPHTGPTPSWDSPPVRVLDPSITTVTTVLSPGSSLLYTDVTFVWWELPLTRETGRRYSSSVHGSSLTYYSTKERFPLVVVLLHDNSLIAIKVNTGDFLPQSSYLKLLDFLLKHLFTQFLSNIS